MVQGQRAAFGDGILVDRDPKVAQGITWQGWRERGRGGGEGKEGGREGETDRDRDTETQRQNPRTDKDKQLTTQPIKLSCAPLYQETHDLYKGCSAGMMSRNVLLEYKRARDDS